LIHGKPYYYLAVSARVDGNPRIVEQKYLGSAEDIEAAMAGATALPSRTRHLAFGDLAATWGVIERLGVVEIIDGVLGARRADAGASVGDLCRVGGVESGGRPVFQAAFRRLVGRRRG
jgi:hypothetical protein